ncbi:response regulator transcription factor [Cysteiniphilum sp. QT6929]|uniref:response regulator transcription factor n=1 Tax=Cysteiniphilum sp. QT6929 TaxID=2975055 RepID=UPI0024B3684B|nr:response regulator transcription factor [Cysteiniphilum sp. QT6929]WHN65127.1 response regulator transcription factor [Cysteiniphilum sp. QT6929]
MKVLVIEDQEDISGLIEINLKMLEFEVVVCANGESAKKALLHHEFSLITIDLNLPDCDGLDLCKYVREHTQKTPILMLTARSSEIDKVEGLSCGADDYLTKPFGVLEFQARVKALIRRNTLSVSTHKSSLRIGSLVIDPDKHKVFRDQKEVELTSKEFDILYFLAKNPQSVYSREQLLDCVWGVKYSGYEHTVNSHINRLRMKLEPDPANPIYIKTVWGVGYSFHGA